MRTGNGKTGEERAEWLFLAMDWRMFRHQPATKYLPGGRVVTAKGTKGIPDFTGYDTNTGHYRAVEVKEATGDSMPCSRVSKVQRDFLKALPPGMAWVAIVWMDSPDLRATMHPYKEKGSYRK